MKKDNIEENGGVVKRYFKLEHTSFHELKWSVFVVCDDTWKLKIWPTVGTNAMDKWGSLVPKV